MKALVALISATCIMSGCDLLGFSKTPNPKEELSKMPEQWMAITSTGRFVPVVPEAPSDSTEAVATPSDGVVPQPATPGSRDTPLDAREEPSSDMQLTGSDSDKRAPSVVGQRVLTEQSQRP